jgi:hypothetical protein
MPIINGFTTHVQVTLEETQATWTLPKTKSLRTGIRCDKPGRAAAGSGCPAVSELCQCR